MSEFRQGKERGRIIASAVALVVAAVVCFLLTSRVSGFMEIVLIIGGLVLLFFAGRQVIDYLSDPVIKIDEKGMTVTGYVPKRQNFSLTWDEAGKAFARAAGAGGGTCTFYARDDPNKVLGVLHGYSRYVNLPELREELKKYMGQAPSYG